MPLKRNAAIAVTILALAVIGLLGVVRSTGRPPAQLLASPDLVIAADAPGRPIDDRLLGTNVPAWLHSPDRPRFDDPLFLERTRAAGTTVLRLPGGSWGNLYDWLACETANTQRATAAGCRWLWAARPSDFLRLLAAVDQPAMWIVSMEGTPESAAALVAFFNGAVDDPRPIGVDAAGVDWRTVGHWAALRREQGFPEPQPVLLWEIGNEVYGARRSTAGPNCAAFGWEETWTCDPYEYVHGTATHAGFLAYQAAMRAVDPTIQIGAVGVARQDSWNNWGNVVIAEAGQAMDFYAIHHYAFDEPTRNTAAILAEPQTTWGPIVADAQAAFQQHADGRAIPIAITEYSLFAFRELDTDRLMTQAVGGLFMADTLGQLAQHGISIANQYNLSNDGDGTTTFDVYGLLTAPDFTRTPQYYAFVLWSRFGEQVLPVESRFDPTDTLSVYAGRAADGTISLLAINKTAVPLEAAVQITGAADVQSVRSDVVQAASLAARSVTFNGVADPADDLSDAPSAHQPATAQATVYTFPAYSLTLLRFSAAQP